MGKGLKKLKEVINVQGCYSTMALSLKNTTNLSIISQSQSQMQEKVTESIFVKILVHDPQGWLSTTAIFSNHFKFKHRKQKSLYDIKKKDKAKSTTLITHRKLSTQASKKKKETNVSSIILIYMAHKQRRVHRIY